MAGATDPRIADVEVMAARPGAATALDTLGADGYAVWVCSADLAVSVR